MERTSVSEVNHSNLRRPAWPFALSLLLHIIVLATEALAKAIDLELAPIRANTVCPGFVDTEPPTPGRAQHVEVLSSNLPLNRPGVASEIADAYLYLFANSYSTGTVAVVDGGAIC